MAFIDDMDIKRDGNCFCITLWDFTDLQESNAVFLEETSWQGKILDAHWDNEPLSHIPPQELERIYEELRQ